MSTRKPLAPSTTKKEFLHRLGLVDGDAVSEKVHRLMMEEARVGRDHLSYDLESIAPYNRDEPGVTQPYAWSQIMETAKHTEVLVIYQNASHETRPFYDRGRYVDGVNNEENWVISWCLWHAFRSFRHRLVWEPTHDNAEGIEESSSPSSIDRGEPSRLVSGMQSYQPAVSHAGIASQSSTPSQSSSRSMTGYYDPVRDL